MDQRPWIVMRSRDDHPLLAQTLAALATQDLPHRLLVLDNASTDGSAELAARVADRVETVPRGAYVPGRVLNRGMELTDGEVTVFLNSDCTPVDPRWLRRLVEPFADPKVCATFGRQEPRPGCPALEAKDLMEAYGEAHRQERCRHWFSMASAAIRRSVWRGLRFDETLRYSEDVDWSWRARQAGGAIRFVPDSRVLHSHAYSLRQFYSRHYGEGQAEARIFAWSPWQASLLRYSLLPYVRQLWSDWRWCARAGAAGAALVAPLYRLAQLAGRRAGFLAGRGARP